MDKRECFYCGCETIYHAVCQDCMPEYFELVLPSVEITASTVAAVPLLSRAGHICYRTEEKQRSYTEDVGFLRSLIDRGHESVIEHAVMSFELVCDRGISHEIVRHRLASYSQESTRYCRYGKIKYIVPSELPIECYESFLDALENATTAYQAILRETDPQTARAVLPTCTATKLMVTMNLCELRHFFKLRLTKAAHPDMQLLARMLLKQVEGVWPWAIGEYL